MIKNFKTENDFKDYINGLSLVEIGTGAEGTAYFDRKNNEAIKIMDGYDNRFYRLNRLITQDDIKVDSYIFPKDLYVCDDDILGYNMDYFQNDLFNIDLYLSGRKKLIDLVDLLNAYEVIKKDTDVLSQNKIYVEDLFSNLVYDGKKLAGIDTLGYYRTDRKDLREQNIASLYYALNLELGRRLSDYTYNPNSVFEDNVNDYIKNHGTSKVLIR